MKKIIVLGISGVIFFFLFIIIFKDKFHVEFSLKTNVKESYTYKKFIKKDTLLLVNHWASWCKPCIEEIPLLNSLKNNHKVGVNFISFSHDKDTVKAINSHKSNNFLWEETSVKDYKYRKSLANFFNDDKTLTINELPRTFLVKNGKIVNFFNGKLDSIQISKAIDKYK